MTAMPKRGLYVITDPAAGYGARLLAAVQAAVEGGAALVQYREKRLDRARRLADAGSLLAFCRASGVPLIVNDDVSLAVAIGAHGVHLGRDDGDTLAARRALGDAAIIGVSCYDELERAVAAQEAGADYVAFGRFFPSTSKPEAVAADPGLLRAARTRLRVPVVAIGGITPANGGRLLDAGADLLAVISAVIGQPDPAAAARDFAPLFAATHTRKEAV